MAEIPLLQASKVTGVPYANLKKQAQRGQVRVRRIGMAIFIEEDDLQAYIATKEFAEIHDRIVGQSLERVAAEAGEMAARLPVKVRDSLVAGALGETPDLIDPVFDPHFGFPIGYTHKEDPKWRRVTTSSWELGNARWTFSPHPNEPGGTWVGGGDASGLALALEISPANPLRIFRPKPVG